MSDFLAGEIRKNARELIRVGLRIYKDRPFIDLRIFADDAGDAKPTAKGVTVAPAKLPELISALQEAEAEARRRGLL